MSRQEAVEWQCVGTGDALDRLDVNPAAGLADAVVRERLELHGPNELTVKPGMPVWLLLLHQFKSPLIYVLLAAAVVALFLGEFKDAAVISGVLIINAVIGFIQEGRARQSMAALKKLAAPKSQVRRNGSILTLPSRDLVPGDILILTAGDRVAADARLTEVAALIALEGALTGESTGVSKKTGPIERDAPLAERNNMVFAGTAIASGRGEAVVVATGMRTELGRIARMVQEAVQPLTPLQVRMGKFSRLVIVLVLAVVGMVFLLGIWRGLPVREVFMVALSQAVSAIPEGLPVAVTVALAVGMQRMARRRAIIRKLAAVETLGSATVICTDKTGTLTRNEMSVTRLFLPGGFLRVTGIGYEPEGGFEDDAGGVVEATPGSDLRRLLETAALCNDSLLVEPSGDHGWSITGDPTEGALVVAAAKAGIEVASLRGQQARIWEIPFDPCHRMMATAHRTGSAAGMVRVCVKGAPEAVMELCSGQWRNAADAPFAEDCREQVREAQRELAGAGLRVLAFAGMEIRESLLADDFGFLKERMSFLGLMGEMDPPRPEVREAVTMCGKAGIRTVMVTGDHLLTGKSVARQLGIADANSTAMEGAEIQHMDDRALDEALRNVAVFGRVAPEHKLRIVEGFQRQGQTVAMTGDGVNDAPALTKADIGVAMGITGTEVAKEASAMVITDDNFATIVSAVEQGRIIFNNIRKAVYYLLSTGAAEIIALMTALLAGLPLPLRAVQILWVNLVTDCALTVNLVMENAEGDEMERRPLRHAAPLVPRRMWLRMLLMAPVMAFGTIGMFWWALESGRSLAKAQTMTFTVLCAFQWFNGLNARSYHRSLFKIGIFSNPFVLAGLAVAVGLQVLVVHNAWLQQLFHTVPLAAVEWLLIVAVASSVLWVEELRKLVHRRSAADDE
jgi:magnesium-transporting ATPase (P-type)